VHPALTLLGHGVPAYDVLLALGACAFVIVVAGGAPREIPRGRLFAWISGTYLAALAGARLAFVMSRLPAWDEAMTALARTDLVGFASAGGVAGGALAAWWLARRLTLPFERLAGPLVLGGCLFGALARAGCFLAGCCHGQPSTLPWAVVYPPLAPAAQFYGSGVAVHPWPLYEAALLLGIAAWLAWPGSSRRAARIAGAALAYLAGRFALDFLRGGASRFDGLTPVQWLALAALVTGAFAAASAAFLGAARKTSPAGGVSLK
jgi:phosphatidylglycerol:prolipoprotein diacylglycerol transferase